MSPPAQATAHHLRWRGRASEAIGIGVSGPRRRLTLWRWPVAARRYAGAACRSDGLWIMQAMLLARACQSATARTLAIPRTLTL